MPIEAKTILITTYCCSWKSANVFISYSCHFMGLYGNLLANNFQFFYRIFMKRFYCKTSRIHGTWEASRLMRLALSVSWIYGCYEFIAFCENLQRLKIFLELFMELLWLFDWKMKLSSSSGFAKLRFQWNGLMIALGSQSFSEFMILWN